MAKDELHVLIRTETLKKITKFYENQEETQRKGISFSQFIENVFLFYLTERGVIGK